MQRVRFSILYWQWRERESKTLSRIMAHLKSSIVFTLNKATCNCSNVIIARNIVEWTLFFCSLKKFIQELYDDRSVQPISTFDFTLNMYENVFIGLHFIALKYPFQIGIPSIHTPSQKKNESI